jgi:carboxylesterase
MNKEEFGILLIHGYGGTPEEVRPLYDYFSSQGYLVESPLLPGHGKTKEALSRVSYRDWILCAEQAYLALLKNRKKIIVIGFSMGGLLAANLWQYGYSALITVNTPIYYWNPYRIMANMITDFPVYGKKYWEAAEGKPLSSMLEFQKLLTKTKAMFENITCRTMVIQTLDDDTVYHKSADFIHHKVCADKTLLKLPKGGHLIFQSSSCIEVCKEIEAFIYFNASIHKFESASLGIRQSPRGERLTDPTFGPSGIQLRLNCWEKNLR